MAHALGDVAYEAELLAIYRSYAEEVADVAMLAGALRAIARNELAANHHPAAQKAALEALDLFHDLDSSEGEVEVLCILAEIAANYGEPDGVRDRLAAAGRRAEQSGNALLVARVLMSSSAAAIMRREFPEALRDAAVALEKYCDIGDREGEAEATSRRASGLSMLQRIDEARAAFAQSAGIYRSLGNQLKYAYVLFNQTASEIQAGLLDSSTALLAEAFALFVKQDDRRGQAACRTNQSVVALLNGEAVEAKRLAALALDIARDLGLHLIEAAALSNLGNAERELGETSSALAHMREAIAIRNRLGRPATFEELGDFALALLASGDLDAARAAADDIIARLPVSSENTVWPHHCMWAAARIYRACEDEVAARAALDAAVVHVGRQIDSMTDPASRAAFSRLAAVREIVRAAETDFWPVAAVR